MDKRAQVDITMYSPPQELAAWAGGAPAYESSGESGAVTVYIERGGGAYLKIAGRGALRKAFVMQEYFHRFKLTSPVLRYWSEEKDFLLTAPLRGDAGTAEKYLSQPKKISEVLGGGPADTARYKRGGRPNGGGKRNTKRNDRFVRMGPDGFVFPKPFGLYSRVYRRCPC